ncbi:C6 finger domain protein, putative [Talaromyces marneffei ATCC 18224]|uniref:C6 finger domain protein, putative n=1 Tax=Talaromyces marneffei (strain ATCC 18224 / CBS 334.59 / QM 7333) TaxID=441960 RepID=B6QKQ4_TALMQ|nr:C6 finger domain protein, putative [Talaromyces marneffei ATCC 18224]
MVKSPKAKVSRITTACNPCRSRKQKALQWEKVCKNGSLKKLDLWAKDIQAEMRTVYRIQPGPAKGYVEALEQRLYETEDVLLKVVSQLNQAQLASILSTQSSFSTDDGSQDKRKTSRVTLLPSRKRGVEYWKSFPLHDAESIQRWQQDYHRNRSNFSPNQHEVEESSLPQPVALLSSTGDNSVENQSSLQSSRDDTLSMNIERDQASSPIIGNDTGRRPPRPRANRVRSARKQDESNMSQLSSWEAAPSKEFQQQFLW